MILNAYPLTGVDDVKFGMKRSEVRAVWGKCTEFMKTPDSVSPTDDFGFCHVYYDEDDRCEGIEIFSEADVYVDGSKIFPVPTDELREAFPGFTEDDDGPYCIDWSVSVWAPDGDPEAVMFARKGYFDFLE